VRTRRYRVTNHPDGSTEVTRTDLGCLGTLATVVAVFFGIAAMVALFQAQWAAFGICLLLCGICLPNFAKRRRTAGAAGAQGSPAPVRTSGNSGDLAPRADAQSVDVTSSSISLADELTKLVALRDQGVLTGEEYATLKAQLLSRWGGGPER